MTAVNTEVDARYFCSAAAERPELWQKLARRQFIHSTLGKGRICGVDLVNNSIPKIHVQLGSKEATLTPKILENGSYTLLLPVSLAKICGVVPSKGREPKIDPSPKTPTDVAIAIPIVKLRCVACKQYGGPGLILSNGDFYHTQCYESLLASKVKLESTLRSLPYCSASSLVQWVSRTFNTLGYQVYVSTAKKQELAKVKIRAIWDFWPTYPPDWEDRRQDALNSSWYCEFCHSFQDLHVHHSDPLSKGGSNESDNLIVLCSVCHLKEHGVKSFDNSRGSRKSKFESAVEKIQSAIEARRSLSFTYSKFKEPDERRNISPLRIESFPHQRKNGETTCVVGFCHTRNANRVFSIKRMSRINIK